MPNELDLATEPSGDGTLSNDQRPTAEQLIEENKKLRSQRANDAEEMRRANQVVKLTRAIFNAPGGKEIIERAREAEAKGETPDFTPTQEKKIEKVAEAKGVTPDEVRAIIKEGLAEHEQSRFLTTKAEKAISKLQERGNKELAGFDKIYETESFDRMMSQVLQLMQPTTDEQGRQYAAALPTPEDEKDPYWFAMKHAHAMLTASAKPPPGDKTSDRLAAIKAQQTAPAGGPTESNPDSSDLAWAKQRDSSIVGKSFANG